MRLDVDHRAIALRGGHGRDLCERIVKFLQRADFVVAGRRDPGISLTTADRRAGRVAFGAVLRV